MKPQNRPAVERIFQWSSVRINFGIFCIGALGTYALIMFSSTTMPSENNNASGINPIFSSAPPSPRATIVGRMDSDQISMQQQQPSTIVQIDRSAYCQQVATSVLLKFNHQITDEQIVFMRNPRLSGSAIQQFATAFGYAIETGLADQVPEAKRSKNP